VLVPEAVGVLGQPDLPEDHRAARAQLLDDTRVFRGEGVAERVVAVRRVHALHVDEVLQQDREPVGWTADESGGALLVQLSGLLERVLVELRDSVEARAALVQRPDPIDVGPRELNRRQITILHHRLSLQAGQRLEVQGRLSGR
jgi:hypothetical protein